MDVVIIHEGFHPNARGFASVDETYTHEDIFCLSQDLSHSLCYINKRC